MGDPKNGRKGVLFTKLAPPQAMTLCLTVRDAYGFGLPDLKLEIVNAKGVKLNAAGGGELRTDKDGRVDVGNVEAGNLTVHVDDKYVPDDASDVRGGVARHYAYRAVGTGEPALVITKENDGSKFFIDSSRAYLTIFVEVDPFTPRFRFPWQNPVHRDETIANDAIYRYRVRALHELLEMVFRQTDAKSLDHAQCVARLIDLFKKNAVPGGGPAKVSAPDPPATQPVVEGGAVPPAPLSEPTPAPGPTPDDVPHLPTGVKVAPPPAQPAPTPPPPPPGPPADPDALPKWVWYLMFHLTGLRYSPKGRRNGAHFSYFAPTKLLQQLRNDEIDARWPGRPSKFAASPEPDPRDVTEAFVLAETRSDRDSFKPGLTETDPAKVKAILVTFFRKLSGEAETAQAKRTDPARLLNGDHFALGLLKAKHLKKNLPAPDLKTLVSHTALRNDVSAAGWEISGEAMVGFGASVAPVLVISGWKTRHKETSDILMNAAVCNQTAEIAENIRGNAMGVGGIPRNALQAAAQSPLLHFTLANAPRMRRGMHLFVTVWGSPKSQDQGGPNDTTAVEKGWWLPIDVAGTTEADIVPNDSIPELAATFADLVDTTSPMNGLLAQREKEKDPSFGVGNVVRAEKVFSGFRRVPEKSFFPGSHDGATGKGNCFIRCRPVTLQDGEPDPDPKKKGQFIGRLEEGIDGKKTPFMVSVQRLELFKWYHQELIVDVRKGSGGFEIFTLSTGGNVVQSVPPLPTGFESATGIRKYVLNAATPSKPNLLVGAAFAGEHPDDDLLLKCYLNTDLLVKT